MSGKLDRLWSPWRLEYVKSAVASPSGCFLCEADNAGEDRARLVLYRERLTFVMMNLFPYNNGHLLVSSRRHVANLEDLSLEELTSLFDVVRKSKGWLDKAYSPHGYNIGVNIGRVAGAGHPEHVHVHIVPRWEGDVNFMPVLGAVKVISEGLQASWDAIKEVIIAET